MSVRSEVIRIMNEVLADSKKITALPAGSAPSGAELVEAVQGGVNVKLTVSQLGGGGGGSQDLQSVLDQGGAALLTGDVTITDNGTHVVSFGTNTGDRVLTFQVAAENAHIVGITDVFLNIGGGGTGFQMDASAMTVTDNDNTKGLVYGADYSANFTARSLVDKAYVDAAVAGGGGNQAANLVYAGPAAGAAAAPTFRSLVAADISNAIVIGKVLTGYVSGAGTVAATDTILQAIQKLNGNIVSSSYYVTPEQFGAVGDGSTDDSTAINNAIATGLPVCFGSKNYRIATTLTTADNTYLFGSGANSIISVATNIAVITIGGINGTISDIQILGSGSGAGQNGITAIGNGAFTLYRYNTRVVNVFFNNLGNAGMYTINTIGNSASGSEHQGTYYAVNCRATSCAVGYLMDTRGEYNTFVNCLADDCPTGVRFNGGNNGWTGGNIVDCTIGVFIGSGTNDGHGKITGANINHTNITCTSTATGYAFEACEIVATSITLTSCIDIRFYICDIASSPITSTSAVGTIFYGNCFRTTPTITVAAGNNPVFVFNTFPAASTVHSLILNTVQGGISQTQQGPTSPNTFTSTWTTTASAQYSHRWDGTITPRATASDVFNVAVYDVSVTATAANQQIYVMNINPAATLSTGGQSGAAVGALRVRGKSRFIGLSTSGAVTGSSGWSYEDSAAATVLQISDDGILRVGNAGSPCQIFPSSDGLVINKAGNGMIVSTGGIGFNINSTSTGAGLSNAHGLGVNGGTTITSGSLSWAAVYLIPTYNQTGTATGDVLGIDYNPTLTAVLGNHYFIRNRSIAANSAFAMTAAPSAKIHIGASMAGAGGASLKIVEGTRQTSPEDGTINYVDNNIEFVETSTVYILAKTLTNTATLNFDLSAVNSQDLTITVTGAAAGDAVAIALDAGSVPADITYFGWVSATDTITIRCSRVGGGGAVDPASGTFRATVIHN